MKNTKKVLRILKKILNVFVTIFVIFFLLIVLLQRFSDNKISFFDFRLFTVITGSMEPKYNVGDVLVAKAIDVNEIKIGDTISYLGSSGSFKNKVVTHEVVDIEKDVDGKYIFHTQGINNLIEDPIVYEDQLYGKVIYKTVILSFIYKVISTNIGMFIFVVIPILYIVSSELLTFMLEKADKKRKDI